MPLKLRLMNPKAPNTDCNCNTEDLIFTDHVRRAWREKALLTMTDSLRFCPNFLFSWMLGTGNHSWPASPTAWTPMHFPNQPVTAQALGSDHVDYYGQCQWGGRGFSQSISSIRRYICIWREVETVSLGSLSPQLSTFHDMSDCPENGQDWTERSPDPKGPWKHKNAYSLHCLPFTLLHCHITELWALALLLYVAISL